MRKLIDLSEDVAKAITIQAINEGTVFKLKAEQILNDYAKPFMVLKKQIDNHILLGGDKPVWFAENKITNNWIKRTFNHSEIEITKDWEDTLIPNEAMVFISREECLDWINKHELRLMYEPTDHLFSLGA